MRKSTEARFWEKVERRTFGECWLWQASTRGSHVRHGQFWVPAGNFGLEEGRLVQAHCVAFYLVHGRWPVPLGLHGCDNGVCCNAENSEHVHEGTFQQNTQEMMARGRWRGGCPAGIFSGERHPHAKFTNRQVRDIRQRSGEGSVVLAAEYGVAPRTIRQILSGDRYRLD